MTDEKRDFGNLFGENVYPSVPGYAKGSKTSKWAALSIRVGSLRAKCYRQIEATVQQVTLLNGRPVGGLTCDECEVILGGRHQTISARFRELVMGGWIKQTGYTRKTRSGREADVYVIAKARPRA